MNPNFDELMADLRILLKKWYATLNADRSEIPQNTSRIATRGLMCDELEFIYEKYEDKPRLTIKDSDDED